MFKLSPTADIRAVLAGYLSQSRMVIRKLSALYCDTHPIISGIVCYDIFENDTYILYNKMQIVSYRDIIHIYYDIPRKYSILVDNLGYRYNNNRGTISYNTRYKYISFDIVIYNCDIYEYRIIVRINPTSITFIAIILYQYYMNNPVPSFTTIYNEYRTNNKNLIILFQNRMRSIKKLI